VIFTRVPNKGNRKGGIRGGNPIEGHGPGGGEMAGVDGAETFLTGNGKYVWREKVPNTESRKKRREKRTTGWGGDSGVRAPTSVKRPAGRPKKGKKCHDYTP